MKNRIFFFLLILASCNLKPPYSRPDMVMPDSFRFGSDSNQSYANLAWWEQFGDDALIELIQKALDNNQDLQVATARVLEFYARYQVVFSQFYPQIGVATTADRIKASEAISFQPAVPTIDRVNTLFQALFQLSYELDFWGRIKNSSDAAKAEYLSQIDARNNTVLTLVTSVAKAYIQLLQFDEQLAIAIKTYGFRKEAFDIAKARFDGGLTSELDLQQSLAELQGAEVQIKNFEALIPEQENLISLLIGQAPSPIRRGGLLKDCKLPPSIPQGLPSDLLENRPDLMLAEQQMIAANARIGVARAAFFPTVTVTGAQFGAAADGFRSSDIKHLFTESANAFDFGAQALQYLFTGGRLTNQLSQAEAIFLETVHNYQQVFLTALQEVSSALIAFEKAQEKLVVQKNQTEALTKYRELANIRYFDGLNDYLTVIDSETRLFANELATASTAGDVFLSLIDIYKSLGQGWDVNIDKTIDKVKSEQKYKDL